MSIVLWGPSLSLEIEILVQFYFLIPTIKQIGCYFRKFWVNKSTNHCQKSASSTDGRACTAGLVTDQLRRFRHDEIDQTKVIRNKARKRAFSIEASTLTFTNSIRTFGLALKNKIREKSLHFPYVDIFIIGNLILIHTSNQSYVFLKFWSLKFSKTKKSFFFNSLDQLVLNKNGNNMQTVSTEFWKQKKNINQILDTQLHIQCEMNV